MKLHDQHVHTNHSSDSEVRMEDYIIKAKELGLDYVAFTDHCDFMAIYNNFEDYLFDYDKYVEEITTLTNKYNIKPIIGVEIGYQTKKIDAINEFLKHKFDLVTLSVHEKEDIDFYFEWSFEKHGVKFLAENYLNYAYDALNSGISFDVLGHIDYVFRSYYRWYKKYVDMEIYRDIYEKIIKKAIELDVAIEINTSAYDIIQSFYYIDFLVDIFKQNNGKYLTVSSDAHTLERYRSSFDTIINHLKEKEITHLTYVIDRKKYLYEI